MATCIDPDAVERYLTCHICQDVLTQPKVLPCLHPFCGSCITQLYATRENATNECTCPLCRQKFVLDYNGIDSLPDFFMGRGILAESRQFDYT